MHDKEIAVTLYNYSNLALIVRHTYLCLYFVCAADHWHGDVLCYNMLEEYIS